MKKLFIFLSTIFLAVTTMTAWAQENPKLSYQAVVRDNQNKLLTNSQVNVEINILKPNDAVQYTETFSAVPTNQNGLMSLLIGNKSSWDNVDWIKAKINVKITLPGGMGMVESTSDVSAVPLAISALYADSVNLGAVPQSDWNETNPAKCTFIKNKPNIPDTIKDQLSDGNSVINHIVDTIVDNHIQRATDTLISNRELRDTVGILRGLIHAATGDVGDLAMRVDNFNRHVCDSVKGCVTGWIADSMEVVRDSIEDIRTDMGSMNTNVLDSITRVNNHVRDTIRTINTALNHRIDTTAAKSIARDNALAARLVADSTIVANRIHTDSAYLKGLIDNLSTHTTKAALCDSVSDCVAAAMDARHYLTSDSTVIKDMQDTLVKHNTRISANYRGIIDTAKAIRESMAETTADLSSLETRFKTDSANLADNYYTKTKINDTLSKYSTTAAMDARHYLTSDSTIIKNMNDTLVKHNTRISANYRGIIDTAKAIRESMAETTADLSSLETRFKADSANLADNYYTKTKINDTLSKYSTTAAMDARHYLTSDSTIIKNMNDTLVKHNTRISANYRGIIDTANKIRTDIATTLSAYEIKTCADVMACEGITTMQGNISTNATAIAANTSKIQSDSTDIMKNVSDTATAIRALITGAHGDVGKLDAKVDSLNENLFDTLHIKYVTNTVLADTIKDVRDSISALRDSMTTNYVSNADLCEKITPCISGLRDSVKNNTIAIHADSVLFAGRIKNLSDSVKMNVQAIIDTADHIRDEISAATADLFSLETRFKADSTNLADNYYTKTKINDTLSKYSTTAAMDARHYLTSDSTIIKNMNDTLVKHNTRILANYKGIIDTAKNLRDAINAINTNLCTTVMACDDIKTMRDSIQTNKNAIVTNATNIAANAAAISAETTNRINADDAIKDIVKADSIDIMKNVSDTAKAIRALITGAHGDVGKLNQKVDSLNNNLFDTLHIKYVTNTVLADTIKDVRDSISALRDSMTTNYVSNADLCDKVMDCADIKTMRDSIQTNAANIKADSIFFAGRVKNLSDSVKMNVQAIIDSSKNIRNEISAATADLSSLETRFKADSANLANNYYTKTKINDTLSKYSTTAAMDARHYLTSDSTVITTMQSNITANATNIFTNTSNIATNAANIAANTSKIHTDSVFFAGRVKDLSDSVNTLYVHTTKAALRDSVAGQIHDSLSTFSSTLHTHANKAILDATTATYTNADSTKLKGIEAGAQKNVNADWSATSGDAQILNKPTIPTTVAELTDAAEYAKLAADNAFTGDNTFSGNNVFTDTVRVPSQTDAFATMNSAENCDMAVSFCDLKMMFDSLYKRIKLLEDTLKDMRDNTLPTMNSITLSDVSSRSMLATATVTSTSAISGYKIILATNGGMTNPVATYTGTEPSHLFTNLNPNTTYYARAEATNLAGTVSSYVVNALTHVATPTCGTPTIVVKDPVTVSVKVPNINAGGAETARLKFYYKKTTECSGNSVSGYTLAETADVSDGATYTRNVSELSPISDYCVKIQISTNNGDSVLYVTPTLVTTGLDTPVIGTITKAVIDSGFTLKVTPNFMGGAEVNNSVEMCYSLNSNMSGKTCQVAENNSGTYSYAFENLQPGQDYYYTVKAGNGQYSVTSPATVIRTGKGRPLYSNLDSTATQNSVTFSGKVDFADVKGTNKTVKLCTTATGSGAVNATLSNNNTTFTVTKSSLAEGTTYSYFLRISNGDSTVTIPVSATTYNLNFSKPNDTIVCAGDTISLVFHAKAELKGVEQTEAQYTWNTSGGTGTPTDNGKTYTLKVAPTATTTYKVTFTAKIGTNVTMTENPQVKVTVKTVPTLRTREDCVTMASKVMEVKNTDTLTYTGNGITQKIVSPTTSSVTYLPEGEYTWRAVKADGGCSISDTITIESCRTSCAVTRELNSGTVLPNGTYANKEWGSTAAIDSVSDHEGNVYQVVQIGGKCWLKENMRAISSPKKPGVSMVDPKAVNGTSIYQSYVSRVAHWYSNDSTKYAKRYGLLYNWNAALDTNYAGFPDIAVETNTSNSWNCSFSGNRRGICPQGWHVPTDAEYTAMEDSVMKKYLPGTTAAPALSTTGYRAANCALSSILSGGFEWSEQDDTHPNAPGYYDNELRNKSGFSAVAAGTFNTSTTSGGSGASFWSATQTNASNAWSRSLSSGTAGVSRDYNYKYIGRSVRCVRD